MHAARRLRAGARPGALDAGLRAALRGEVARLEQVSDPVARINAVNDSFAALDAELSQLAAVRLRAIAALRGDGWTYTRLVASTGLSKARVAQLARQVRHVRTAR